MIQRLAFELSDDFSVRWPGSEHQGCPTAGMASEYREHPALSVVVQMEKAVPGENTVESHWQTERSHIGYECVLVRETRLKHTHHGS